MKEPAKVPASKSVNQTKAHKLEKSPTVTHREEKYDDVRSPDPAITPEEAEKGYREV